MLPNILLGLGIAVAAPLVLPAAASGLRPLAKTLIRGGLYVTDAARQILAEATEQVGDLVAEVRAESKSGATATATERGE